MSGSSNEKQKFVIAESLCMCLGEFVFRDENGNIASTEFESSRLDINNYGHGILISRIFKHLQSLLLCKFLQDFIHNFMMFTISNQESSHSSWCRSNTI